MEISWTNLKKVMGNLVTSKALAEADAALITQSVEADATALMPTPVAETPTAAVAVAAPVPVPIAAPAPAVPVAAAPVAAPSANDELATLRAHNAQLAAENSTLKAKVTPGLAAAVPSEDATQTGSAMAGEEENPHYADLKRIKSKFNRWGLTAEINLGAAQ